MARNRGMYVNYRGTNRRRGRRDAHLGTICGVLIVVILAALFGVMAYKISGKNLDNLPNVPTLTPVPGTPTPTLPPTNTPTPTPSLTPTPTPEPNIIGAYAGMNLNTQEALERFLELADTTELNAVVIDVKADTAESTGRVTYRMDNEYLKELGVCMNQYTDMKGLLKTLKEHGIYTIARVVCFKDNFIGQKHPEYMLYKNDGTLYKDNDGYTWMNPYNEDTWKYIVDISEQAALDGFDEICFDYIRVSTNGIVKKQNEDGSLEYKVNFGEKAKEKTLKEVIAEFTKYAYERLKPLGVNVSASVYGIIIQSSVDSARVGQDYVEMSKYLDYICPMIYPSHYADGWAGLESPLQQPYELVDIEVRASIRKLSVLEGQVEHYAECRPWLQAFWYTPEQVREQIKASCANGYNSWFLWNPTASYKPEYFLEEE